MRNLFVFPVIFLIFGGCATAARKAQQQAEFKAQFDLLTPEQQHQIYYEAFKDSHGIGRPPEQPIVYYQPPIYTPPPRKVCYPNGFGGVSCNTY